MIFKNYIFWKLNNCLVMKINNVNNHSETALPQGDEWKFQPTNESELVKIIKTLKTKIALVKIA
jgi:hypothetical protein